MYCVLEIKSARLPCQMEPISVQLMGVFNSRAQARKALKTIKANKLNELSEHLKPYGSMAVARKNRIYAIDYSLTYHINSA